MKIKTIRQIIASKFDRWANSIEDEALRKMVMDNTIITGGCIVSMLLQEKVNDFDIYFRNYDTALAVARHYAKDVPGVNIKEMDEDGVYGDKAKAKKVRISIRTNADTIYKGEEEASDESEEEKAGEKFTVKFMSSNAITLSGKIQLVMRFYGNPEDIHKNYDFVHCTSYWSSWDNKLVTPEKALAAILTRELIYVGSKYPLCSLIRIRKFVARGWTITAGQMLKIILQLNELKLTDIKVLQDQLVGVDSAYFAQLLTAIKDVDPEKMNATYLGAVIDNIHQ